MYRDCTVSYSQAPPLQNENLVIVKVGEPGIVSSHVSDIKGRKVATCMWAYLRAQNGKKSEGTRQLT